MQWTDGVLAAGAAEQQGDLPALGRGRKLLPRAESLTVLCTWGAKNLWWLWQLEFRVLILGVL